MTTKYPLDEKLDSSADHLDDVEGQKEHDVPTESDTVRENTTTAPQFHQCLRIAAGASVRSERNETYPPQSRPSFDTCTGSAILARILGPYVLIAIGVINRR